MNSKSIFASFLRYFGGDMHVSLIPNGISLNAKPNSQSVELFPKMDTLYSRYIQEKTGKQRFRFFVFVPKTLPNQKIILQRSCAMYIYKVQSLQDS